MRSKYIFCLLFIVTVFACSKQKKAADTGVDVNKVAVADEEDSREYYPIKGNVISADLDRLQEVSVSDYFKHIELIPLETNDETLIGRSFKLIHHQNSFYIVDNQQFVVFVFDEDGKCIQKIDKEGQGPGEYFRIDDMVFNPHTNTFDLISVMGGIYSYDLSWNHIRTNQTYGKIVKNIYGVIPQTEERYLLFSNFTRDYALTFYDRSADTILHKDYEETKAISYSFIDYSAFYKYNGQYFFYRGYDRDVYLINSMSLSRSYTWDFGKHNYDVRKMSLTEEMPREVRANLPYRFVRQGQNNRYVIAQIRIKDFVYAFLIYDKSSNECKFFKSFSESVGFRPLIITNEYVLAYCRHGEIEEYITKEMLDEPNQKKFDDLMGATDERNPIIIKYSFK